MNIQKHFRQFFFAELHVVNGRSGQSSWRFVMQGHQLKFFCADGKSSLVLRRL